jgi:hypothetical protein
MAQGHRRIDQCPCDAFAPFVGRDVDREQLRWIKGKKGKSAEAVVAVGNECRDVRICEQMAEKPVRIARERRQPVGAPALVRYLAGRDREERLKLASVALFCDPNDARFLSRRRQPVRAG